MFTVWRPIANAFGPRGRYPDPERTAPPRQRGRVPTDRAAEWVREHMQCADDAPRIAALLRASMPAALRARTVIVVAGVNPDHLRQLTPAEQAGFWRSADATAAGVRHADAASLAIGQGWTETHYIDLLHLSERGGRRLARELAPRIRELARDLGYLEARA